MMRRSIFLVSLVLALLCGCVHATQRPQAGHASEATEAVRIAVVPFGLAAGTPPPPVDVAAIIHRDLSMIDRLEMAEIELPERPTRLSELHVERWREVGVDYLVIGLVAGVHDGGHEVEFRLLDPRVDSRERATVLGWVVASAPDALEATAHRIATMVGERLDPGRVAARVPAQAGEGPDPIPR